MQSLYKKKAFFRVIRIIKIINKLNFFSLKILLIRS